MDPNATLADLRELVEHVQNGTGRVDAGRVRGEVRGAGRLDHQGAASCRPTGAGEHRLMADRELPTTRTDKVIDQVVSGTKGTPAEKIAEVLRRTGRR